MSGDLLSVVLARADGDSSLSEDAKLLVLAALQSDDDFADALDTTRTSDPTEAVEPLKPAARAFLASITVEGFRGIGNQVTLTLNPAPGLTVIAGRNGCGKSSFAEALEVALTRGSYRWKSRKGPGWRESWRNLHQSEKATIAVELAEEGQGLTTVAASWPEGAVLDGVTSWVQRRGAKREPGLAGLGWASDLELYRPFLSYDELGTLFAEQGKLYEALSSILGLERLEDAQRRLDDTQKPLGAARNTATVIAKELKPSSKLWKMTEHPPPTSYCASANPTWPRSGPWSPGPVQWTTLDFWPGCVASPISRPPTVPRSTSLLPSTSGPSRPWPR